MTKNRVISAGYWTKRLGGAAWSLGARHTQQPGEGVRRWSGGQLVADLDPGFEHA